jgi:4-hydroxybenzoate polyprenyltransferase
MLVIASSFIVYATYTLDRSLENKEDEINQPAFSYASKKTGLAISGIAILIGISLFFSKNLFFPPLFPFIVGILYSRGIPLRNRIIKLKAGSGIKNLIIGLTWGGTLGLIIISSGQVLAGMIIGIYFGMKLFINSTIFDMKDVKGDFAAGIKTLPVLLDEKRLKCVLLSICIIQHTILALAMMSGILVRLEFFLIYSLVVSGLVILFYSPDFEAGTSWSQRNFRVFAINGEPIILVIIYMYLLY